MGLAYILKRMLNPLITHTRTHAHTRSHTCIRAYAHGTHMSLCGCTHIATWRRPAPRQRVIYNYFLFKKVKHKSK